MALDYAALATELSTDPTGLGYSGTSDPAAAVLLNAIRQTIDIDRGVIPAHEIIDATVPAEWAALTADERSRYQVLTGAGQVNTKAANVRAAFLAMFPGGSGTRTALAALQSRKGSRAEELFGPGVTVSHTDVAIARGRV